MPAAEKIRRRWWLCPAIIAFAAALCGPGLLLHAQGAAPAAVPLAADAGVDKTSADAPWFGDMVAPVPLSEDAGMAACRAVFAALESRSREPRLQFPMVADTQPRVVFVTWRTTGGQVKIQEGRGRGLAAAVRDAVAKAVPRLDAGGVRHVKLDVVQDVLPVPDFVMRNTDIPLPCIIGIAFSAASGFAFLPDELVFLKLLNGEKLDAELIGLSFSEAKRLPEFARWTRISGFAGPQLVYLFEPQSFFADRSRAEPLFAGQRLISGMSLDDLDRQAAALADFLVVNCLDNGRLRLPTLLEPKTGQAPPADEAVAVEIAIGLAQAWKLTGNRRHLDAAAAIVGALAGMLQPPQHLPQALCLPTEKGAELGVNALLAVAMAKVAAGQPGNRELRNQLRRLGLHLVSQLQPGGNFVESCAFPSGWPRPSISPAASARALAGLVEIYEVTADAAFLAAAKAGLQPFLLEHLQENVSMAALPQDDWLFAALDRVFTHERDARIPAAMERMGMAVMADQVVEPVLPNLLGSWKEHPSVRLAARKGRALAHAVQLLADRGSAGAAADLAATMHLYLAFAGQGVMDEVTTLYLNQPETYAGAFREDVLSCRFSLETQAAQLQALTTARQVCGDFLKQEKKLPLSKGGQAACDQIRAATAKFPRVLLFKQPATMPKPGAEPEVVPQF